MAVVTDLNVVVQKVLFPQIINDLQSFYPVDHFENWHCELQPHASFSDVIGRVSATHRPSRLLGVQMFSIPMGHLEQMTPEQLFRLLDTHINIAVRTVFTLNFHVEGQLCLNQFCEECYA